MSRKKVRRFDPAGGVSQDMLDVEAKYVAREVEDYLVQSLDELKHMLSDRQAKWLAADGSLQVCLETMPKRERLTVQCLVVRDLYHLLELYVTYARSVTSATMPVPTASAGQRAEQTETDKERPIPFSEWLFGPTPDGL